jgi:hypothetical protein
MKPDLLTLVIGLAHEWTRLYTRGLPPSQRERRCREIESDLWESHHDADRPRAVAALQILSRLARGLWADLAWRVEQSRFNVTWKPVTVAVVTAVVLFTTFWLAVRSQSPQLPPVKAVAVEPAFVAPPPPPPPPAPPPRPVERLEPRRRPAR